MDSAKVSTSVRDAVLPSMAHFTKVDLEKVVRYGTKLVSAFHQYTLAADRIPVGFEGISNIFDASIATLNQVSSLFGNEIRGQRYEHADHPFSNEGLSYVRSLVLESARAFRAVETAIADSCLPGKEFRAKRRRDAKTLEREGKVKIDFSTLNLDEKPFSEQLEQMSWECVEDVAEKCVERLYDLQLRLLLVFQVVKVDALSKDLSEGTVDVQSIVTYHERVKRTAKLIGIILPEERRYSSSSDSDVSDCSDYSSVRSFRGSARVPPPPPPGQPPHRVLLSQTSAGAAFPPPPGPGPYKLSGPPLPPPVWRSGVTTGMPPPPLTLSKDTVDPPSYKESRGTDNTTVNLEPRVSNSNGSDESKASIETITTCEKEGEMESKDVDQGPEITKPSVLPEPRLLKSKPNGFTFKLRTMFRSKQSLAEEMQKALSHTDSHLVAFVIKGPLQRLIPHSSFHSLETTHMRTILSQLNDDTWCNVFTTLSSREHMTLHRILHPYAEGQVHERQIVALKVIQQQESRKLQAWTALLGDLRKGTTFFSQSENDGRVLLVIAREKLVDGKPLVTTNNGPQHPPPPPPPFAFGGGYPSSNVHRPTPIPGPMLMQPNHGFYDISSRPPPPGPLPARPGPPPPPGVIPIAGPTTNLYPTSTQQIFGPPGPPPNLSAAMPSVIVSDLTIQTHHDAELALTSYAEYTIRPCHSESPHTAQSWLRVTTTLESSSPESVRACVAKFQSAGGDVLRSKLKLVQEQTDQVSRLMESLQEKERDLRYTWCWVLLHLLGNTGEVLNVPMMPLEPLAHTTRTIHLVARRSLKSGLRALDVYNAMMRAPISNYPPPPAQLPLPPRPAPRLVPPIAGTPAHFKSSHDSDSGTDDSSRYQERRIKRIKARNTNGVDCRWKKERYLRKGFVYNARSQYKGKGNDSDSDSDSDAGEVDVIEIELTLKRGEDVVKRLLEMWTPRREGE